MSVVPTSAILGIDEKNVVSMGSLHAVKFLLTIWQALMIVLLGTCVKVAYYDNGSDFNNHYQYFTGVEIMMFIGFGYLMTFLKRYGMGALGLTMLITILGLEWGIWIEVRRSFFTMISSLSLI